MGSYSPSPEPELIHPEPEYIPPTPQPRPPRPGWQVSPASYLLIGINCAVFLAMVFTHVSPWSPTGDQLLHWGGDHTGHVLILGEWWRIVTAMFVHVGIIHLATNMWCLWNLGLLAEPLLGSAGLFAAYILSGAAGNLLSTLWNWYFPDHELGLLSYPVGAGASGAVFGIAGVLIVLLKSPRLPVPQLELRRLRRSVISFAGINLAIGFATMAPGIGVHIDNMAHLGGFACGLIFAAPLVPRLGSPRRLFTARRRMAVVLVVAILTLFAFYIAQLPG
jgi:rhomboid protease GluP